MHPDPIFAATGRRQSLAYSGGKLTGIWTHDSQGRLESIAWHNGLANVSQHQYTFDAMNRRTTALREDAEQWRYAYNPRGEVTSGVKARTSAQEAALRTGLQFGYGYDLIGNRVSESVDAPGGAQSLTWNANAANQITQRETPDARWVLGRAHPEAALAVTGGAAPVREGAEFAVPVTMTDAEQSEWRAVSITASRQGVGRNGGNVSQTREGKLWLPASPESFEYDADGNLTADGRWSYEWDAENRLKAMQTLPAAVSAGVPAQRLEFAYDAQSRRIRKRVQEWNDASGSFSPISDHRFLYDGWNLVAEFKADPLHPSSFILQTSFAWGLDLSGTEQGAGGVGGLLLVEQPSSMALAPCYDGNGNITAYVNLESGAVQASFDYDPFGKPVWTDLSNVGDLPPFRFSTKYEDVETGLVYYGFRYYSPDLGRWINRDPIEEEGGFNLYGMVGNDVVNKVDVLGLKPGARLTKNEAKGLSCALGWYLRSAAVRAGGWLTLGTNWSPKLFKNYVDKSGDTTMPYTAIKDTYLINRADNEAVKAIRMEGRQKYKDKGEFSDFDLMNALGGVAISYESTGNGNINGKIHDYYTFAPNRISEKMGPGRGITLHGLSLMSATFFCCWDGGDKLTDAWLEDLEKHGFAKSFYVDIEWTLYATPPKTSNNYPPPSMY